MKKPRNLVIFILLSCCLVRFTNPFPAQASDSSPAWRLVANAWCFKDYPFFEAVDKTAALGIHYTEAFQGQKIAADIDATMDYSLTDDIQNRIKEKLQQSGITLTSFYIHQLPSDPNECRKVFEFCRKMNLGTIVSEPLPEDLDTIEKCCDEFGIDVAIHNHAEGLSRYWHPREVMKVCEGRSKRIGVCADTGHWQRSGLDPVECLRIIEGRLISVHLKDLNQSNKDGHDVPWGTGVGKVARVLGELRRQQVDTLAIGIEYEYNWNNSSPEIAQCAAFYHQTIDELKMEKPLSVGWASIDITPDKPVALVGQLHKRISQSVLDPLTATALALETMGENGEREQAIMVSCDVLFILKEMQERIRERIKTALPDFDPDKLFLNATHTHTAPGFTESTFKGLYDVSQDEGVMTAAEYGNFFVDQITLAAVRAWQNRKPGGMSWGLGHAVVGMNRRAHYADGTSVMYGNTNQENFIHLEGYEDHGVNLLYFWTMDEQLTGVVVNLACTSQETEGLSDVSADFWHDTRLEIRRRLGQDIFVFPQCSVAGDLSPHLLYNSRAEEVMRERRGLSRRQEIARRITDAVEDVIPFAKKEIATRVNFKHCVGRFSLPIQDASRVPFYEIDSVDPLEMHVLRIGDIAIATNPFELYLDYGVRIKARSPALSTFLVQLSCQASGYLPTEKGVQGGGYSADKFLVGPDGGQILVNETVQRLQALWER